MRGIKAKAVRRIARGMCDDPVGTSMRGRGFKVPALLGKDMNGNVIEHEGKPIVLMPAHVRYTMYWPSNSYRRILRELKTDRRAGAPVTSA